MTRLPALSAGETIRALARLGYDVDHQPGGHVILRCKEPPHRWLTVPNHKELVKGTLRSLIRAAGLTVEEFLALPR